MKNLTLENNPRFLREGARFFNKRRKKERRGERRVTIATRYVTRKRRKEIEKFHFGPRLELNLQDGVAFVVKNATSGWPKSHGEREMVERRGASYFPADVIPWL